MDDNKISISMDRYEELVSKEATLEILLRVIASSKYSVDKTEVKTIAGDLYPTTIESEEKE